VDHRTTVEFALTIIIIIVMVVLFGGIELTVLIYTYNILADSAKKGVRYAIVHGTGVGAANCSGPGGGSVSCIDSTGTKVQTVVNKFHLNLAKTIIVATIPSMNKATNPICVHCSDVGLFQFIWRTFVLCPYRNAAVTQHR
jgi:hypothetical protein